MIAIFFSANHATTILTFCCILSQVKLLFSTESSHYTSGKKTFSKIFPKPLSNSGTSQVFSCRWHRVIWWHRWQTYSSESRHAPTLLIKPMSTMNSNKTTDLCLWQLTYLQQTEAIYPHQKLCYSTWNKHTYKQHTMMWKKLLFWKMTTNDK